MTTNEVRPHTEREPGMLGQTVVVIGGSAGIGLETTRRARAEGADVILTGRNPERLQHSASEVGALSTASFDATDSEALADFFEHLEAPIDHVMATAASSTLPCLRRCSATSWTSAAKSCARHCRWGASSDRPTSPRSPSTS